MKRTMLKKGILLIGAVLFAFSFANASVASEAVEATASEEIAATKTINGSILAIHADTGMVDIKDASGEMMSLKAGSDIKLDAFNQGDNVTVECSDEGMITNINLKDKL